MKKQYKYIAFTSFIGLILCIILIGCNSQKISIDQFTSLNRFPEIHPDYSAVIIPPNMAPMNFIVKEKGTNYFAKIYSAKGKSIEIVNQTGIISIPEKSWHALLNSNAGEKLQIEVFVKDNINWNKFKTISNHIAGEKIDPYLMYRKIHPYHNTWCDMGLYQRNLQNYDESPVLKNDRYRYGCAHCHTFSNNNPELLSIVIRSSDYPSGQLMIQGDNVYKMDGKLGFTAFHPSSRLLACTINKPRLILHANRNEMRDIIDMDSWIGYFFLNSMDVKTIPQLSRKDMLENYPTWSPDGKYLYFTCAKKLWSDQSVFPPEHFREIKYSLMRIPYNVEQNEWGEVETVLSSRQTGLSINQPRISPDGNWITFPMCAYSCWPSYHPKSDLYILDVRTTKRTGQPKYRKMEINSDECESWHSWSSNSRWIVFSSKRNNPLFNRTYITYIDTNGTLSKPFVIPQKDPAFYDSYLQTYTIPELATGPVKAVGEKLARVIRGSQKIHMDMAITGATAPAGRH